MSSGPRLALVYFLLFGWVGVYLPYFPGWLSARGLTGTEIGVLLGIVPWTRIVIDPALGQAADRTGRAWAMIIGLALVCAAGLLLYECAAVFPLYVVASVLVGVGFAPISSLTDGIAVVEARERRIDYARVRAAGSVAFIVAVLAVGYAVERAGYDLVPALNVGLVLGLAASATLLPRVTVARPLSGGAPADARTLLRRPRVRRFLVGSALVQASHAVVYNFGTLHWERAGIGHDVIGQLWAIGVVVEVAVFMVGSRVADRFGPTRLMVLAGVGGAVRWAALASTTALVPLFAAQSLHAMSFALLHLGALEFIRHEIPEQHTATGLYAAAGAGIGMGVAGPVAGVLFDAWAGGAFWGACVVSVAGTLVLLRVAPTARRDPPAASPGLFSATPESAAPRSSTLVT